MNWEDDLIAEQQDNTDPTPIYTELKRKQREEFWARMGVRPEN